MPGEIKTQAVNRVHQRKQELVEKVLAIIEQQVEIAQASALAPDLEDPEARAEMTKRQQRIAAHALLPPKEAPLYLHGAIEVMKAAAKNVSKPEEEKRSGVTFNVVMPAPSVEAWEQSRKLMQNGKEAMLIDAVVEEPEGE